MGSLGPLCTTCDLAAEPIGIWRQGPQQLPVLTAWRYGGPIADVIVAAKFRGQAFHPERWLAGLDTGLLPRLRPMDALVPIAPHLGRLVERGQHLPDQIAWAIRARLPTAQRLPVRTDLLRRLDDAAPRSTDTGVMPRFDARPSDYAVWLVDDVITSGRTLTEAYAAFTAQGVTVRGALCLADANTGGHQPI